MLNKRLCWPSSETSSSQRTGHCRCAVARQCSCPETRHGSCSKVGHPICSSTRHCFSSVQDIASGQDSEYSSCSEARHCSCSKMERRSRSKNIVPAQERDTARVQNNGIAFVGPLIHTNRLYLNIPSDHAFQNWLAGQCLPIVSTNEPKPLQNFIHVGSQYVPYTHKLKVHSGSVYCTKCGSKATNQVRRLAKACTPPGAYGLASLRALMCDKLLPGLDQ